MAEHDARVEAAARAIADAGVREHQPRLPEHKRAALVERSWTAYRKQARAALAAADAVGVEGWKLVPMEPTPAMNNAIAHADWFGKSDLNWADGWRIMLAAAPLPPQEGS